MFKQLRIKFIAVVMASVAIVLAITFTGICLVEYQRSATSVEEALASAIDHASENRFNGMRQDDQLAPPDSTEDLGSQGDLGNRGGLDKQGTKGDSNTAKFDRPRIGRGGGGRNMVPVAVYTLSESSSYTVVSGFTTATIEDDVLQAATSRIGSLQDGSGTFADLGLHYKKATYESATYVAFADTSNTDTWQQLALTLLVAGIAILAVFFVISLFLSKWALRPVREAWDAQRQFVADASHDLKTPLTVILANSSILLKHPDHTIAKESQWIESTQVEAQQMQGLVNEMLELAQIEAGAQVQDAPREDVDFSDLVDGESLLFDSVALERNCQFTCSIEEGIQVKGDRQRLQKMTSTLIENAFKYVDDGGSIDITLAKTGRNASLTVRNTGSLITEEDLPHIFDRFYRADKARTSGTGGFGLGLAIAREIARSHNGDITCTSSASDGTAFIVTLPV